MNSLVVLFALASVACGSLVPLAQPPHHPAIVLDLKGRPLDTAEVINARALHLQAKALEGHYAPLVHAAPLAHSVVAPVVSAHSAWAAPAAVSHQSRVDVISSPAVVSHAAPVWGAHAALASPLLDYSGLGLAGHGHYLKKRSLGHLAYSVAPVAHSVYAPAIAYAAPSAVSHQSRVDVISKPAVVSHAVVAPVVSTHSAWAAPVYGAHSAWAAPAYGAHSAWATSAYGAHSAWAGAYGAHGHLLKKRSLALAHAVLPSAVSHQSRVDVISSPAVVSQAVAYAAPVAVAHAVPVAVAHAAPAVSHQSRVDVISTGAHLAPVAHSAIWTAPTHLSYSGLFNSSPLVHAAHW